MKQFSNGTLSISKLKWTGFGLLIRNHTVYNSEHEKQRHNYLAFIVKKNTAKIVLCYNEVNEQIISIRLHGQHFNMMFI